MTKGFYCPYHAAVASFFLKTLAKRGLSPLSLVTVVMAASAIADPDSLQGGIPFRRATAMRFAE